MSDSVAICLLNYNGSEDTISCVKSIIANEPSLDWQLLIYDNASELAELEGLRNWLKLEFNDFTEIRPSSFLAPRECNCRCILFSGPENLGFAKANNWLMQFALDEGFDRIVLLNNDTELVEASITKLLEAYDNAPGQCDYATTDIRFYSDPDRSWNAGGSIFFGTRRYYKEAHVQRFQKRGNLFPRVDFITGCFLLLDRNTLKKVGFLSEAFFFGEEDYEFALRAKERGAVGRVLLNTHILHKVGATVSRSGSDHALSRDFVHRLNRAIDMKHHYNLLKWRLWLFASSIYFFIDSMKRFGLSGKEAVAYVSNITRLSALLEGVGKGIFERLIAMDRQVLATRFDDEALAMFVDLERVPLAE